MSDREILEIILQKVETVDNKLDKLEKRLDNVEKRLDNVEKRLDSVEKRLDNVEKRLDILEKRIDSLEQRVEKLEQKVDQLEQRVEKLEIQVAENTQILKALEHLAEVNKAEHDNFTHQLARIEGILNSVISSNNKDHELLFAQTEENSQKITRLEKDLNIIESVCGKNMQDIAFLKGIKN